MGKTPIQWAPGCDDGREGHTINPFRAYPAEDAEPLPHRIGHYCIKISDGCKFCYSARMQKRFHLFDFTVANREKVNLYLDESKLQEVMQRKKPTGYFWCDMTDMFLEDYPDEWIDRCFATMALTPQHSHMVLTKRAERMWRYFDAPERLRSISGASAKRDDIGRVVYQLARRGLDRWPLPNVRLGVSCENQEYADKRISAAIVPLMDDGWNAMLSCEPLLGPIRFSLVPGFNRVNTPLQRLWVVAGGESGNAARPCNIEWIRSILEQCRIARVPVFVKQLGANPFLHFERTHHEERPGLKIHIQQMEIDKTIHLQDSHGGDPSEWPADLRVREFPEVAHGATNRL